MSIPRSEHPRPQLERADWECLNGKWEFEIDKSASGKERKFFEREHLDGEITVPFCPESKLSGVGDTDFLNCVWYKRGFNVKTKEKRVIFHIDACDYLTTVYINGVEVGTHKGGYTSFAFDITDFVEVGENSVVICAEDDTRAALIPSGKQSDKYASYGCFYTRTTGIWQSVWLEYVEKNHIKSVKYYPDYKNGRVTVAAEVCGEGIFAVTAGYEGRHVGSASAEFCGNHAEVTVELSEIHLWEPGHGRLYDLELTFGEDKVKSYFGLRNVWLSGYKFMLNGKCVFLRTVLDQGFYPDGIYTAPTDSALENDIKISMAAGFNGARLHEKVFEPRFLYHCDKLGYMVWGEYANWGIDHTSIEALPIYLAEWTEAMERDFNSPAIIGWCPFNETWDVCGKPQRDEVIERVYKMTKLLDRTRPCIDTSGNYHVVTDIFDFHDYRQEPEDFKTRLDKLMTEDVLIDGNIGNSPEHRHRQTYRGEPVFASEYGGIKWDDEEDKDAWGYGNAPKTREEFVERYRGLTEALLNNYKMLGFCYTQLYDVEQERNGLYTYDRKPKFDMEIFKKINTQKAAIED